MQYNKDGKSITPKPSSADNNSGHSSNQTETLCRELQDYKQILNTYKDENEKLKVKLRRLEESLRKRSKIVDTHYLGPHNKLLFKEAVAQFSFKIEKLEHENIDLKAEICEKDRTIAEYRNKLNSYAAYKPNNKKKTNKTSQQINVRKVSPISKSSANGSQTFRSVTQSDTQTPISNCTLTPHEEIEKLHSGFKDIISEVDKLKQSINEINQEKERSMRNESQCAQIHSRPEIPVKSMPTTMRKATKSATLEKFDPRERHQARKIPSTFTKVATVRQVPNRKTNKKPNPLAVRTLSNTSLTDETDMKLYIDEVLTDMNRNNF